VKKKLTPEEVKLLTLVRERKKAGGPYDVSTFFHLLWGAEAHPERRPETMRAFAGAIAPGGCLELKPENELSAVRQYVHERKK
jgi:hypothetical protein